MYRPRYRARARAPVRRRTTRSNPGRRYAPKECHCPGELTPAQKFIYSQADPFDPKCLGAKIPDSSTVPSISVFDVENVPLTLAVATNQKCYAFLPQYTFSGVAATEGAAGWTWPAAFAGSFNRAKRTQYNATYELDRPIAHAIRLSSSVAPTSATGFVHVAIGFESNLGSTTWTWPTTTASLSGCQFYRRVTLASLTQSPLTIINKFTDETAFRYQDRNGPNVAAELTGTANSFQILGSRSWGALLIAFEGVGTLAPLNIEHLLMTEAIPNYDSSAVGTTAAPNQPSVIAAAGGMAANTDFVHTEAQQDTYVAQALDAARQGAAAAGDVVMEQMLIPIARQAGYNAVGTVASYVAAGALGLAGVNANPNRLVART
jgi:hypothetical protein